MLKMLATLSAAAAMIFVAPALAQQPPVVEPQRPAANEQPPATPDRSRMDQGAALGELVGLDVYGSDGQKLGEVTKTIQRADGTIDSIHVDIGTFLGIGGKTVKVRAEQFTQTADRVELLLTAANADALPEVPAR